MELRKMQIVGRASFSVTLPPDWVKENKLKPSDQITITKEDDGSLRLVPGIIHEEEKEVKIKIDADRCKDPGLLRGLIVGAYLRGSDTIEVVSKHGMSEMHSKEIRDSVDSLMGLGIIESTSDHVTIQSMVDHSKFPVRPLLKRLCELSSSMYEDAMRALKDKDASLAANIMQRENEVNKIYWLTQRQLAAASFDKRIFNRVGLRVASDINFYRAGSTRMWSTATYAVDIANNEIGLGKTSVNDEDLQKIIRLGKMAQEIFSNACEAFFNGDVVLANKTIEALRPFEETREELMKKLGPRIFKDVEVGLRLIDIIRGLRRIARYGKTMAELTIENSAAVRNNLP
jgi:phosphate uptake regulator